MTNPLDSSAEEEFEELTEDESTLFRTLLQIGSLTETVDVFGHKIVLKTLTVNEDLQVGLLLKKYNESLAFDRAYKTLLVAAAVRTVDGHPLIETLSMDEDPNNVQLKFDKVTQYYPPVIDKLYTELTRIEGRIGPLLSRLGKNSG